MVSTLPIALKNLPVLLIGAGNVALQKASVLYDNAIPFHVVSQEVSEKMKTFTPHIKKHPFKKKDVEGFMIIIDATGNSEVTETLLEAKKETNFLLKLINLISVIFISWHSPPMHPFKLPSPAVDTAQRRLSFLGIYAKNSFPLF